MRKRITHIGLCFSLLFFWGCSKEVTQDDLIQAAVEIKLKQWQKSQLESCREKALSHAEDYVDSLLLAISLQSKLDTIPKPEKPFKPLKPEFKQKPDSVVVKPIYKEDEEDN
jgi:hypothetical protein